VRSPRLNWPPLPAVIQHRRGLQFLHLSQHGIAAIDVADNAAVVVILILLNLAVVAVSQEMLLDHPKCLKLFL